MTQVALITGAATGIGAATARKLAERGLRVAVCDVNAQAGQALAKEIDGLFIDCDVTKLESVERAVATCVSQLGVPDYGHLNAGIMTVPTGDPYLSIEDVSLEQYRRIIGVNLDGVFYGTKALLPIMKAGNGGAITITASIAGLGILPVDPLYATTKYGLIGFTRGVAGANEGGNVRINAICPGVVDTAIVPDDFRGPDILSPDTLAAEVVGLLTDGANGEIRVKMSANPAFAVHPTELEG
ncbi:MAG: SDR family oxidoreductase [Pseudomonadaceae bacterium]|nr:SDR family oxidoreductase [Pseudomonadaceae bacterium]